MQLPYIHKEISFKELAHVILGADKSETLRAGQLAGNSGRT